MSKMLRVILFLCVCFLGTACGAGYVVNSAGDDPDIDLNDGKCETVNGDCTLRAAIMEANLSDDVSLITFENVTLIYPLTPLPDLTAANTHIDGGGVVTLNGKMISGGYPSGLRITDSSYNIIQGLIIRKFWYGISITSGNSSAAHNVVGMTGSELGDVSKSNVIVRNQVGIALNGTNTAENEISGNFIGVKSDGHTPLPNQDPGIFIGSGAHDNIIGSLSGSGVAQGGNLISGNTGPGIHISAAYQNHIAGNFIGTDSSGVASVSNFSGIRINNGSMNNAIGLSPVDGGSFNLISGNLSQGIEILDQGSVSNMIAGNLIGTTADGSSDLGNNWSGISTQGHATIIGTNGDGADDQLELNVISGNGTSGIELHSDGNRVSGNIIGLDLTGSTGVGNSADGIVIAGDSNLIGTNGDGISDDFEGNLISANDADQIGAAGISIMGNNNTVSGNRIGTDSSGLTAIGNSEDGINLGNGATANLIGTDGDGVADAEEANLISGNGRSGIFLNSAYQNIIAGNLIGVDITGSAALPNGLSDTSGIGAVYLGPDSSSNVIGTNGDGHNDGIEGNTISGNARTGIKLTGPNTSNNILAGNLVGVDINGTSSLGNQQGIVLGVGADYNLIGTDANGTSDLQEGNTVCGNGGEGIVISGSHNQIAGNHVGTDQSGTLDLGNGAAGILVGDNTTGNVIGGSSQESNSIAFNQGAGVVIAGLNAEKAEITYNSIHSNQRAGIYLDAPGTSGPYFTPNDPGDIDAGPNDLMNYPELDTASSIMTSVAITGEILDGLPSTQFEIQFFSNPACDAPSDHGEGKTYIGSSIQQTDSNGSVQFLVTLPAIVPPGSFITSTATNSSNTSEFSECVEVADAQTYMEKADEEEFPCEDFLREEMSVVSSYVDTESGLFTLYVKNPFAYPIPGESASWGYSAQLGEIASEICSIQDFEDRVYCRFNVPEEYFNSAQPLQLFSSLCGPPIYINDQVSILVREKEREACRSNLGSQACTNAGGTYTSAAGCLCP